MARILVVDDEELVRFALRQTLEFAGHEVVEASNGRQAIEHYAADPTDLVITDIIMPEQEGIATITELRGQNPYAKIIAISGGGRTGNMDFLSIARKLGANDILTKPFDPDELIQMVTVLLAEQGVRVRASNIHTRH